MVCTFTNTRDQGSVQLKKIWRSGTVGETHPEHRHRHERRGRQTDNATKDLTVADEGNGQTDANGNTGTYYFSEIAPGHRLHDELRLHRGRGTSPRPRSANPTTSTASPSPRARRVVCTFTNTRDQGSVQLKKSWGTGTVGETTLNIGTGSERRGRQRRRDQGPGRGRRGQRPDRRERTSNTGTYYGLRGRCGHTGYTTSFACTGTGDIRRPGSADGLRLQLGRGKGRDAWSAPSRTPGTRARSS